MKGVSVSILYLYYSLAVFFFFFNYSIVVLNFIREKRKFLKSVMYSFLVCLFVMHRKNSVVEGED